MIDAEIIPFEIHQRGKHKPGNRFVYTKICELPIQLLTNIIPSRYEIGTHFDMVINDLKAEAEHHLRGEVLV